MSKEIDDAFACIRKEWTYEGVSNVEQTGSIVSLRNYIFKESGLTVVLASLQKLPPITSESFPRSGVRFIWRILEMLRGYRENFVNTGCIERYDQITDDLQRELSRILGDPV